MIPLKNALTLLLVLLQASELESCMMGREVAKPFSLVMYSEP